MNEFKRLNEEEITLIREIIVKDKRWHWLATMTRNVAAWVVGIIAAMTIGWDWLVRVIKGAVQ